MKVRTDLETLHTGEINQGQNVETSRQKAEKASFLYNISHDIRTPMNEVLGFIELTRCNISDTRKAENALSKAQLAANQTADILNNVLEMSAIQDSGIQIKDDVIDVRYEIMKTAAAIEKSAEDKQIDFEIIDKTTVPFVFGDGVHLSQAVINLLTNAVTYTQNGGKITYYISNSQTSDANADFKIIVRDNGIEMSEDFRNKILDLFSHGHNAEENKIGGAGLGLIISKQIIDAMGGMIECSSSAENGTEFTLTLTLPAVDIPGTFDNCSDVSLNGKHILLVEDNELSREIAKEFLTDMGCHVTEAENGAVAVNILLNSSYSKFDIVLMDIQMPVMDGYTATKKIRSFDDTKISSIPIVAVTANAFQTDRDIALSVGMNEHITKPISFDILKNAITRVLSK